MSPTLRRQAGRKQAEWLKEQLDAIGQRIEELSKEE
jgi:hypothetical protein